MGAGARRVIRKQVKKIGAKGRVKKAAKKKSTLQTRGKPPVKKGSSRKAEWGEYGAKNPPGAGGTGYIYSKSKSASKKSDSNMRLLERENRLLKQELLRLRRQKVKEAAMKERKKPEPKIRKIKKYKGIKP